MLQEEDSVICIATTIGIRISPAIQQVPGGSGGFFRRGVVIDYIKTYINISFNNIQK